MTAIRWVYFIPIYCFLEELDPSKGRSRRPKESRESSTKPESNPKSDCGPGRFGRGQMTPFRCFKTNRSNWAVNAVFGRAVLGGGFEKGQGGSDFANLHSSSDDLPGLVVSLLTLVLADKFIFILTKLSLSQNLATPVAAPCGLIFQVSRGNRGEPDSANGSSGGH